MLLEWTDNPKQALSNELLATTYLKAEGRLPNALPRSSFEHEPSPSSWIPFIYTVVFVALPFLFVKFLYIIGPFLPLYYLFLLVTCRRSF